MRLQGPVGFCNGAAQARQSRAIGEAIPKFRDGSGEGVCSAPQD